LGQLVVDPFAGRGTVLRSAKRHRRQYFGTEIDSGVYLPEFVAAQKLSSAPQA
jgi:DNA modification methylase